MNMWSEWETHTEVCTAWTDWAGADAEPKWEPCLMPATPGERHCAEHSRGLARQERREDGTRQRLSDGPPLCLLAG
jgi:hypothetical protein